MYYNVADNNYIVYYAIRCTITVLDYNMLSEYAITISCIYSVRSTATVERASFEFRVRGFGFRVSGFGD